MGRSAVGRSDEDATAHLPSSPISRCILYGRYEPTARARQMIKNREYRYVSAAFAKDYPDRKTGESQGLTLTSVALTNQPFLDELPEIWLSVSGVRDQGLGVREPKSPTPNPQPLIPSRLSAEQGGSMAKLNLKCSAEGTHEAYDGDRKVGEIENNHLFEYAATHGGKDGGSAQGNLSARAHGPGCRRLRDVRPGSRRGGPQQRRNSRPGHAGAASP